MNLSRFKCKNNYINVFMLGIITALIIFLPFLIMDKGLFLYYGDYDVQQIPFYKLSHAAVQNGFMGWNWNTDLGANFIGSYSFYTLGSPFFWLTLLFPNWLLPYLMAPLYILKFGLTCVTGYAFISRFTKFKNTAVLGALLYAFCGFNIYNIFFNHFNEVVLVFPLLLIGLEELVINNRRGGFALAVALCAMINYYFFFGQVIFVIIYFIIRATDPKFNVTFKKFCVIVVEAILGVLMSAVLLLPAVLAILGNTRLGNTLNGYDLLFYTKPQRYGLIFSSFLFPPDIPARPNFFPDTDAKWASVSMYLPMISIAGVIAFFKGEKKHWAKKIISISVLMALIPVTNAMFSAMNYNYYARWFYMPLLIMAMVSCIALEKHNKHLKSGLIITAILVGGFSLVGILPKKTNGEMQFFQMPEYPDRFWAYITIALIGILLTALLFVLTRKHKHFMKVAISGILSVTIMCSIIMIYTGKLAGDGYDVVAERALAGEKEIIIDDDEFYRIDSFGELDNLGMFWNKHSINAFHSIVPASVMDYYKSIGGERGVASRPDPKFIGVRALTSTKYSFMDEKETTEPMLGFDYFDTQLGYKIYKNNYFVPMGFTFDKFITQKQFDQCLKENKDRLLLKGLLLSDEDYSENINLLQTYDYEGEYVDEYSDESYFDDCTNLNKNTVTDFVYDKDGFESKIVADKENFVFFSVPYDKGWTATVNGIDTKVYLANEGFMAVVVPKGNSAIRFDYETPGLKVGLIVTIVSLLLLVAYTVLVNTLRRKGKIYGYDKYAHIRNNEYQPDLIAHDAYIKKLSTRKQAIPPPVEDENLLPPIENLNDLSETGETE